MKILRILGVILLATLAMACASPGGEALPATAIPPTAAPTSTMTLAPTLPLTPKPSATQPRLEPSPTRSLQICPPFPGWKREALLAAISNPFRPPRPGRDEPHQAVDIAVAQDGIALPGGGVQAMMAGRVAAVIVDRFPYGNALMIETRLSADWLAQLALPALAPTVSPNPALTCPALEPDLFPETGERSLYVLYAHMQAVPDFSLDEAVACGAELGKIGQSGNALNPHLHVEVRLGPAGARFAGMAHYVSNASTQEMSNYCSWRVRNIFQLIDPVVLLQMLP